MQRCLLSSKNKLKKAARSEALHEHFLIQLDMRIRVLLSSIQFNILGVTIRTRQCQHASSIFLHNQHLSIRAYGASLSIRESRVNGDACESMPTEYGGYHYTRTRDQRSEIEPAHHKKEMFVPYVNGSAYNFSKRESRANTPCPISWIHHTQQRTPSNGYYPTRKHGNGDASNLLTLQGFSASRSISDGSCIVRVLLLANLRFLTFISLAIFIVHHPSPVLSSIRESIQVVSSRGRHKGRPVQYAIKSDDANEDTRESF
ncbi:hypothetical protein BJ508DRAFT_313815 [Ascobolus immersus RN42]|uniref:Uncharacterized protein n=1 Tax=Ascobolus immersus RN42 TaxID=1160509 RepID=A0A3N4HLK2_ASCIM|nr:hypothetical protein BJ508DRAFT_313815 [Ascobolus immersus RN42]